MTFRDAQTGWVTGSIPADGHVYLYITHDGGVSGHSRACRCPPGYQAYQYMAQAPVFFGKDGFLPLTIYRPGTTDLTFYTTPGRRPHLDGRPGNPDSVIKPACPPLPTRCTPGAGMAAPGCIPATTAPKRGNVTKTSLNLGGNLSRLEFVPGFTGWALTRLDEAGHSQLYRTTDGVNWTPLIP